MGCMVPGWLHWWQRSDESASGTTFHNTFFYAVVLIHNEWMNEWNNTNKRLLRKAPGAPGRAGRIRDTVRVLWVSEAKVKPFFPLQWEKVPQWRGSTESTLQQKYETILFLVRSPHSGSCSAHRRQIDYKSYEETSGIFVLWQLPTPAYDIWYMKVNMPHWGFFVELRMHTNLLAICFYPEKSREVVLIYLDVFCAHVR